MDMKYSGRRLLERVFVIALLVVFVAMVALALKLLGPGLSP